MKFDPPLKPARFTQRYKRFLVDMVLPSGEAVTGHCPNTGSMKNCLLAESPCWYSLSNNPKRKYAITWEVATTPAGFLAGINTGRANHLVKEAIESGVIAELNSYDSIRTEVKYGEENSRIDLLLAKAGQPDCYVEVKNVTLDMGDGEGQFPDAVSARGSKHLRELALIAERGQRAVLLFCVQHTGIDFVRPADDIDPEYGRQLRLAIAAGVEVFAYKAAISPAEIALTHALPVVTD